MAIPREAQAERAALIRYLRGFLIPAPDGETEAHFNDCMETIIRSVVAGKHVEAVRRGR